MSSFNHKIVNFQVTCDFQIHLQDVVFIYKIPLQWLLFEELVQSDGCYALVNNTFPNLLIHLEVLCNQIQHLLQWVYRIVNGCLMCFGQSMWWLALESVEGWICKERWIYIVWCTTLCFSLTPWGCESWCVHWTRLHARWPWIIHLYINLLLNN